MAGAEQLMELVADVLEKNAAYYESLESARVAEEQAEQQKSATALASRISEAVGEPLDEDLIAKLSTVDSDIHGLLERTVGSVESVDSLGGVEDSEKVAGLDGLPPEDARFLAFVNS